MAAFKINEVSCSSSLSGDYTYDVFLSFRGEDARFNFIGHLYKAFTQRGIETFLDDRSLQRGRSISPEIENSIRKSRFAVVVFSQNYAKSSWCMEELVEIIRCMEAKSITVLPIFHGVDPSDVRNQTGTFALNAISFKEDERDQVPIWQSVLTKAANLSGWDDRNRDEASVIEEVAMHVLTQLSRISANVESGLIGMGMRMNKMKSLLEVGLNDVRMIGICGMGGIGKTTIAEQIYRSASHKFDGCCFLERVREVMKNPDGHTNLQKHLLSTIFHLKPWDKVKPIDLAMRSSCVLIVLDDVDNLDHLEALAARHDWFGPGSRIIITSRNKQLLEDYGVDYVYEVELLNDLDSLKLFKQYAFKVSNETEELAVLSQQVVNYAKGLPLAVKVLGSTLTKRTAREWKVELDKLKVYPPEEVQTVLRVSFHGLSHAEKKMFLDIACFFNGDSVEKVVNFWESCSLFPVSGLTSLQGKCLISITKNKILMHDLLQEMGRNIVRDESEEPGGRSRLWDHNDVYKVLLENKGTNKIEGMVLDLSKINKANLKFEALSMMTKLKLLKICNVHLPTIYEYPFRKDLHLRINRSEKMETVPEFSNVLMDKFVHPIIHSLKLVRDMLRFPNELRCLHWHGCPLRCFDKNFYPQNLVELDMSYSRIVKFWTVGKQFDWLKIINLCNSKDLVSTPSFTGMPNLEILILKGCSDLKEVHPSVGLLRNLMLLNLEDCKSLRYFPNIVDTESLEVFLLSGCVNIEFFPDIQGNMERLSVLNVDGTAIKELPFKIGLFLGLQVLSARNCKCLTSIPASISKLKALRILDFSGCSNLQKLPNNLEQLENLEELQLDETAVTNPPTSIGFLKKLQVLSFRNCKFYEKVQLPRTFLGYLKGKKPYIRFTTPSFHENIFLAVASLMSLDLSYSKLVDFSVPDCFGFLSSLRRLDLSGNKFHYLPDSVCCLQNLEVLHLAHCENLQELPALPSSIYYVDARNCHQLSKVSYPIGVNCLCMRSFNFMNCKILWQLTGLVTHHIQQTSMQSFTEFSIIVAGSSIPMWTSFERRGNSTATKLPKHWYNGTFRAFLLWAVFEVLPHLNQFTSENSGLDFDLRCNTHSLVADNGFIIDRETCVVSDHVWLRYFSSPTFKMTRFNEGWSEIEAFLTTRGRGLHVKKCGLYPLCWDERSDTLIDIYPEFGESSAK